MPFPTSDLSYENVLRDIHDPVSQSIRTTANAIIAPGLTIDISHVDDSVRLGDGTNFLTSTNVSGKIGLDVNIITATLPVSIAAPIQIEIDAADGDNILIVGTEDGSNSGTQHTLRVGSDLNLRVRDDDLNTTLSSISSRLPSSLGSQTAANSLSVILSSDQGPIDVVTEIEAFTGTPDNIQIVGSIDGTKTGTKYGIVYNLRQQVLDSHDREADITYSDFGTKDQRVTRIDYTSNTFSGFTIRRDFNYTLVGTRYRRDSETWTVV